MAPSTPGRRRPATHQSAQSSADVTASALTTPTKVSGPAIGDLQFSMRTLYIVLAVMCAACYVNTLNGSFVHDDRLAIVENADSNPAKSSWASIWINDFWGTNIRSATSHKSYRPLTVASFRLNALILGTSAYGYHLVNILLHMAVTLLFARLCEVLFGRQNRQYTAVSALLFAAHPIHVEVVANLVGRAEMLSALGFLLSFFQFRSIVAAENVRSKNWSMVLCALFAACAMLFKETGFMVLPFCATYYVFVDLGLGLPTVLTPAGIKHILRSSTGIVTFLGITATSLLAIRLWIMQGTLPTFLEEDNPASFSQSVLTRTLTYSYLFALNSWLLLFPRSLCFDWQMSGIPLVENLLDTRVVAIAVFYVGFCVITFKSLSRANHTGRRDLFSAAFAAGFLLVVTTFLPASNLLFRVGFVMADRVLYMPSMGFCILAACAVQKAISLAPSGLFKSTQRIITWALVVVLVLYAAKTVSRNTDWNSRERINLSGIEVNPLCAKCHYNLANFFKDSGRPDEAATHYQEVLRLWPNHPSSHNNYGTILETQGKLEAAEHEYKSAIRLNPAHASAYFNLGNVHKAKRQYPLAASYYQQALIYKPEDAGFHAGYAETLYSLGDNKSALESTKLALKHDPHNGLYHMLHARLLHKLGDLDSAMEHYKLAKTLTSTKQLALTLDIVSVLDDMHREKEADALLDQMLTQGAAHDDVDAMLHFASMLVDRNRQEDAVSVYKEILKANRHHSRAVFEMAKVLQAMPSEGPASADRFFKSELKTSGAWELYNRYGIFLIESGRKRDALRPLTTAVEVHAASPERAHDQHVKLLRQLGTLQADLDESTAAEASFRELLTLDPSNPDAHFALGNLLRMGNWKIAEEHFKNAVQYSPKPNSMFLGNLGALYHLHAEFDDAKKYYELAIAADASNANAVENLRRMTQSAKYKEHVNKHSTSK